MICATWTTSLSAVTVSCGTRKNTTNIPYLFFNLIKPWVCVNLLLGGWGEWKPYEENGIQLNYNSRDVAFQNDDIKKIPVDEKFAIW